MPLYNNILSSRKNESEAGENNAAKSSPSASMKLLQDHLQSKRRLQQQQQQQQNLTAGKNRKSLDRNNVGPPQHHSLHQHQASQQLDSSDWNLEDEADEEYDPMVPNSYEAVKAEYLKSEKRRLANRMSSATKKLSAPLHLLDVIDNLDDDNDCVAKKSDDKIRGTAIAPPPSLSSSRSNNHSSFADNRLGPKASHTDDDVKPFVVPAPPDESTKRKAEIGASIAAKLMSKMGYKQGQGLGRDERGISGPLEVEKSGFNVGKIAVPGHTDAAAANKHDQVDEIKRALERARKESTSRILLLQNMVGPGEVDEDLESETKEECKKYGDVVKCLIYEIPNKRVPDDEAVRIFVEFSRAESALKAANDLNGRYFGGRIVRASFYSVEKFNKYELAP